MTEDKAKMNLRLNLGISKFDVMKCPIQQSIELLITCSKSDTISFLPRYNEVNSAAISMQGSASAAVETVEALKYNFVIEIRYLKEILL